MTAEALQPKAVYEPVTKLEAFYTGGAVRVTRDHKHLVCACGDEVKVLDVATGVVARTLPGDSEPITSLAVSPDCRTLIAASRSLVVKQWDWTTGECSRSWKPHRAPVADLAVDASGGYVASGSADRSIKVTDLAGGFVTHHFTGHGGIVLKVLFHPKQLLLFSSCDTGEVRIWDLVTKSCAYSLSGGHMSAVPALALSPDGWHLMSGGRDKVVCVWDIRNGRKVATVPVFEALEGLAVLPAGSAFPGVAAAAAAQLSSSNKGSHKALCFATAGEKGQIRIWRVDSGTCVYTHQGSSSSTNVLQAPSGRKSSKTAAAAVAAGDEFVELMLLPGGKGLLAATGDARLLFYYPTVDTGVSGLSLTRQLIGNHDEITDLAFLYIASSSSSSDEVPSKTQQPATAADSAAPAAAAAGTAVGSGGLVLQPGEPRRLAVASNSHDIRLFDLSDASCVGVCAGHRDIVLCLDTVSPATGVELLASGSKDCEVRIWNPATCTCLAAAAGHVAAVTTVAWSKSKAKGGRYLASGGADKLLKLWDTSKVLASATAAAETGEVPAMQQLTTVAAVAAHEKDINAVAFSPNDALLATASQDRTVKLWKLPHLVLTQTLRGHKRGVWDVTFSPVDQVVLTSSADKLVKMWSVSEGTCLRTFEGHTAGALRCMFLTAGTQVLSAGADGLLKLWDSRTGVNSNTFEGHEDRLWGLAASAGPAESLIASGGGDARVVIWRDVTAVKAAEAEAQEEGLVLKQQELSNALADGDYATAARLAFQLRHPGRLLEVLRRQPGGPAAALTALQGLVGQLEAADLATALSYCREWNTNTRNAYLAQVLLQAVLKTHAPQKILAVPGARELLDGLSAYSQRHVARLDRLMRASFLLDYTLAASQVLLPEESRQQQDAGQQQQQQGIGQQQQPLGTGRGGDDLDDDFGDLGEILNMNGHTHSDDDNDDDSDDDSLGPDDDPQLSQQSGSDNADDNLQLSSSDGDDDGDDQQDDLQPSSSDKAAVVVVDDYVYVDDGVKLPGWGGDDDYSDVDREQNSDSEPASSSQQREDSEAHSDSENPCEQGNGLDGTAVRSSDDDELPAAVDTAAVAVKRQVSKQQQVAGKRAAGAGRKRAAVAGRHDDAAGPQGKVQKQQRQRMQHRRA